MSVEINDLLQYRFLSELSLSPSANKAAFIVACSEDTSAYTKALYIIDVTDKEIIYKKAAKDISGFAWCTDDSIVIGINTDGVTQFIKTNLNSIETVLLSVPFFAKPIAINSTESLLFTAFMPVNEEGQQKNPNYKILDELPFWSQGQGFVSKKRTKLFMSNANLGTYKLISPDYMDILKIHYDAKTQTVIYSGKEYTTIIPKSSSVYLYDTKNDSNRLVLDDGKYIVKFVAIMQDLIAVAVVDCDDSFAFDFPTLLFYSIKTGELVHSDKLNFNIANSIGSDCRMGAATIFTGDGDKLYFVVTQNMESHIYEYSIDELPKKLTTGRGSVDSIDIKNGRVMFIGMRNFMLQELFEVNGTIEKQLTSINSKVTAITPEHISFVNNEENTIYGSVFIPLLKNKKEKPPLLIYIHGGPHLAYGDVFFHEIQMLVSAGYCVAYCNPTGSDGRDEKFGNIRSKWGTVDYDDIMSFLDTVLTQYENVNHDKIVVCGGSYGGYITNWIIGHTNRFTTAISERSISNCISQDFTGDNPIQFAKKNMGTSVYEDFDFIWNSSPLKYAYNVKTPTLFIHSIQDYRCHFSQSVMMYTAIRSNDVYSKLVLFKGENHDLSRSGKPSNRIRRLEEIKKWLDKYLQPSA